MEDMEYPIMTTEAEIKAACYYKRKYSAIDTNKAKMKLNLWISNKCTAKSKRNMIEIRLKILSREYDHIMGAINKLDEILN